MMFDYLCLEFDVRLTGLRSGTHLNGREGVVRGQDPKSVERWNIRMDGGTCVSEGCELRVHPPWGLQAQIAVRWPISTAGVRSWRAAS